MHISKQNECHAHQELQYCTVGVPKNNTTWYDERYCTVSTIW